MCMYMYECMYLLFVGVAAWPVTRRQEAYVRNIYIYVYIYNCMLISIYLSIFLSICLSIY